MRPNPFALSLSKGLSNGLAHMEAKASLLVQRFPKVY